MNVHTRPKPNGTPPARSVHPGSGRRKTRETPKGRQVDPQALDEVRALLADRPRRADLLIEHLHLIQDKYGCLHARHLVALANEMRLALVEVYEVASFYAHFDIVMEEEPAPPPLTVRVCDSLTCAMMGAERLLAELTAKLEPNIRVVRAPCMGGCHNAPVTAIGHALHEHATVASVTQAVAAGETHPHIPAYPDFERYRAEGGYRLLATCLDGTRSAEDVIKPL
jgi:formate dehydrogenase beta subunit